MNQKHPMLSHRHYVCCFSNLGCNIVSQEQAGLILYIVESHLGIRSKQCQWLTSILLGKLAVLLLELESCEVFGMCHQLVLNILQLHLEWQVIMFICQRLLTINHQVHIIMILYCKQELKDICHLCMRLLQRQLGI